MGGFRPFSLDRPRHNEIAGAALDMLRPKGEGGGLFGGVGIKLQGSMEMLNQKIESNQGKTTIQSEDMATSPQRLRPLATPYKPPSSPRTGA